MKSFSAILGFAALLLLAVYAELLSVRAAKAEGHEPPAVRKDDPRLYVQGIPQNLPDAPCCSLLLANDGDAPMVFNAGTSIPNTDQYRSGTLWPGQSIVLRVYAEYTPDEWPVWTMVFRTVEPKCGDMNLDGRVDLPDFATFGACYGLTSPNDSCPSRVFHLADMNKDGEVGLDDYASFAVCYGV